MTSLTKLGTGAALVESAQAGLGELSKFITKLFGQLEQQTRGHEKLLGLGLILLASQLYYYNKYSYWRRRNVKHPTPLPLVGNALSHLIHSYQDLSRDWSKKYGKVYGYYQGAKPYLVVADANVLKQICIKDFDKFTNRHFFDLPSDFNKQFLILKNDDHWRSLRHILSPTFSSGKIKMMYRIMDRSVNKMADQLDSIVMKQQAEVNIRGPAGQISMSSTIGSLYGIDLNFSDARDPNSVQRFSQMSLEAFTPSKLDLVLQYLVPHSILRLLDYPNLKDENSSALQFFVRKAKGIIQHRLKSGERQNDYLQILLEARAEEKREEEQEQEAAAESHHAFNGALDRRASGAASKKNLTEAEVICQTVMFMLVATETTAGLIANTLYLLAFNKRVQQRLFEELAPIRRLDGSGGRAQFNYEDVSAHPYLDCVISESLRLMPPALYLDRKAGADYWLDEYQFTIPRGTPIFLDFYGIMTDPEYWPEPERFEPERFAAENKANIVPGSYCPFGIGPRHCIGYRFALTEGKLAVAKLVSEFEFDVAPGAQFPPEPRKPVFIGNEFTSLRTLVRRRST